MSDELPAAAVEAGEGAVRSALGRIDIDGLRDAVVAGERRELARAVLVAASERIECPGWFDKVKHDDGCACGGTGFLYVLKQSENE